MTMSTQALQPSVAVLSSFPATSAPDAIFLMCPPKLYDVDYVINPWMSGNVHASCLECAAAEWQQLYAAVSRIAKVVLVEPQPGSPDMVFTANAGLEHNGIVVLSSFFHPERQGEEAHFRRWFHQAGFTVLDIPRDTPFEGEGDALFSVDGSRLWVANGPRSVAGSHHYLANAWDVEVTSLDLVDPRFYHLDTCFAPLTDGSVLYYPAAFAPRSLAAIEAFYPPEDRIVVTEADAIRFACNTINVGRTIILNEIGPDLAETLESRGFDVIQVNLSEFLKAGGAAKCLVMKLSRSPEPEI
jgi:N-dimethylarginine dimethylaminohydrolase